LAFAGRDELIGDYSATSSEGFDRALNISAYSLAPLCKAAHHFIVMVLVLSR